jgi:adenosylhomocysteine nucleosidase
MSFRRVLLLLLIVALAFGASLFTYWRVTAPSARPFVGIASAFPAESRPLAAALDDVETIEIGRVIYIRGRVGETDVVLFVTGAGMVNAASRVQHAIDHFQLTALIFSGVAGALDPDLAPGTVIVPDAWANHQYMTITDDGRQALPVDLPPMARTAVPETDLFPVDPALLLAARRLDGVTTGGAGVSGDAFVASAPMRDELRELYGAAIVDMESAAAAQVALLNGVPFVAVRAVSDSADNGAQADIEANVDRAADAAARAVIELVRLLE